jgi:dienelactone hydrolase
MRSWKWIVLAVLVPVRAATAAAIDDHLREEEVAFASHGTTLSGSIVFPRDLKTHAAVVFIHGSGKQARNLDLARRLAGAGIAALVYDKRGAGKSAGEYAGEQSVGEKNISLLADDANAAFFALTQHPSLAGVPAGFAGISQAGWIAPLAAERNPLARFVVLWSGPVCKVSEEDIFSKYTSDAGGLFVPTYREALASRKEAYVWPDFLGKDSDPMTSLATLTIPGLWIFSDNDGSVPVDLSIARLQTLRQQGHPYDYVLFSGLGHNNMDGTLPVATQWMINASSRAIRTGTAGSQAIPAR